MNSYSVLRARLQRSGLTVAPGGYDSIGARLIERAAFNTVYMTEQVRPRPLGYLDHRMLTMDEMVENVAVMTRSIKCAAIGDVDTGYGDEFNAIRTVQACDERRVAAFHIDDAVASKRCAHLEGKEVVTRAEFISKIRAAAPARRSPDFVLTTRGEAARSCRSSLSPGFARTPRRLRNRDLYVPADATQQEHGRWRMLSSRNDSRAIENLGDI